MVDTSIPMISSSGAQRVSTGVRRQQSVCSNVPTLALTGGAASDAREMREFLPVLSPVAFLNIRRYGTDTPNQLLGDFTTAKVPRDLPAIIPAQFPQLLGLHVRPIVLQPINSTPGPAHLPLATLHSVFTCRKSTLLRIRSCR